MAREVKIAILGDAKDFERAMQKAVGSADGFSGKLAGFGKTAAIGLAAAGVGAVALGKTFVDAAVESQKVTAQTEAVLKSMGNAAGVTSQQVADLSTKLSLKSGVDDELIQSGQNLLLTFGKVRNEVGAGNAIFDRATGAALDMSVAMGTDMKSASIQIGKALNDPIKGMTALTRSGVSFTDQQKDQVKAMVAAGDTLGAQKLILGELDKQFGGSAKAQATATDKLKVAWGNVQEQLGAKLLPVVEKVSTWLAANLPTAMATAGDAARKVVDAFKGITDWAKEHQPIIVGLGVAIGVGLVAAFTAWAVSAAAATAATIAAAAPVIAIGAAIAALTAGVIWAYQNWDWFRDAVDKVAKFVTGTLWPALKTVASWITGTLVPTIGSVVSKLGEWATKAATVAGGIKETIKGVVSFIAEVPGKISEVAGGMFDGIKNAFKSAINWIIKAWNGLEFKIPGFDPPGPGPKFDGFTLGVPNIPQLAKGGIVTRPTLALIGEAGPEAVIPLGRGRGGGTVNVHLTVGTIIGNDLGSAAAQLAEPIRRELLRTGRRNGTVLGDVA